MAGKIGQLFDGNRNLIVGINMFFRPKYWVDDETLNFHEAEPMDTD